MVLRLNRTIKKRWISLASLFVLVAIGLGYVLVGSGSETASADANGYGRHWMFGDNASIRFPAVGNTPSAPANNYTYSSTSEGVTVVSGQSGDLKFWANGYCVYYRSGTNTMRVKRTNGNDLALLGQSTATQTVASFPLADNRPGYDGYETRYAIVTTGSATVGTGSVTNWPGHQARTDCQSVSTTDGGRVGGLYMSIIRKQDNGAWVAEDGQINVPLNSPGDGAYASEALSAVPDATGEGYWVYTYSPNTSPRNVAGNLTMVRKYIDINGNYIAARSGMQEITGIGDMHTCGYKRTNNRAMMGYGSIRPNDSYTKIAVTVGNVQCNSGDGTGQSNYYAHLAKVTVLEVYRGDGSLRMVMSKGIPRNNANGGRVYNGDDGFNNTSGYYADFGLPSGAVENLLITQINPFRLYKMNTGDPSSAPALVSNGALTGMQIHGRGGAVTRGPDGAMYVADFEQNSILRIRNVNSSGMTYDRIILGESTGSRWGLPQQVTIGPCVGNTCTSSGMYNVVPSITVPATSIEEGAQAVESVSASVTSSTSPSASNSRAFVARFVVRAGSSINMNPGTRNGHTGGGDCGVVTAALGGSAVDCERIRERNGPFAVAQTSIGTSPQDDSIPSHLNVSVGDRICYVAVVSRYAQNRNTNDYRYSAPDCVVVSKSPKVQFWGADVLSVNQVVTRGSTIGGAMYGSWAEYGIFSPVSVNSASGARLSSGPTGRPVRPTQELNTLTFANIAPNYGNFGATPRSSLPANFTNTVTGTPLTNASIDLSSMDSGEYLRTGNLQISGNVRAGRDIIIKSTGNVTITGNITYDDVPYTSKADMPQLVISANNIIIDESVTEVSAWLIANRDTGYVSTCGQVSGNWLDGLNSSVCSHPLKINGPVISGHLYLRRTGGSEVAHRGSPAEILNLRPDTYLWANSSAGSASAISTMKIRELPPRF